MPVNTVPESFEGSLFIILHRMNVSGYAYVVTQRPANIDEGASCAGFTDAFEALTEALDGMEDIHGSIRVVDLTDLSESAFGALHSGDDAYDALWATIGERATSPSQWFATYPQTEEVLSD